MDDNAKDKPVCAAAAAALATAAALALAVALAAAACPQHAYAATAALDNATVTVGDQAYTGKAVTPVPKVTLRGKTLIPFLNYSCTWRNNTAPGKASVTVHGRGAYTGSKTAYFEITGCSDLAYATVKAPDQAYTGAALKPAVQVACGGKALAAGVDYDVAGYAGNVNAGKASVTVRGRGGYTGSKTATFAIVPASIANATVAAIPAAPYTGKAISPTPKVTYAGKTLAYGRDYTLSYRNNKAIGTGSVVIAGRGNFTGTKKASFKIGKSDISKASVTKISDKYTTGLTGVTPSPKVTYGGKALKKGTDYTLSYKNNVKPGTASVTVKGMGSYTGSKTVKFELVNMGDDLARTACKLSYSRKVSGGKGTKKYVSACQDAGCYFSPYYGRSCVFGISTIARASGYDKSFPKYNWDSSWNVKSSRSYFHYLKKGEKSSNTSQQSGKWAYVGTYPADKDKLLPGDVLLVLQANGKSTNHIWMYVGNEIAKEVYKKSLKGTDADKGAPTGAWVQGHGSSKSAPSIEGANTNYDKSPNPVRIYRCVNPDCK